MKKILAMLFAFSMLASCGPHRMRCGARGICNSSEKQILIIPEKISPIKA